MGFEVYNNAVALMMQIKYKFMKHATRERLFNNDRRFYLNLYIILYGSF